jgi:hypothetical protein
MWRNFRLAEELLASQEGQKVTKTFHAACAVSYCESELKWNTITQDVEHNNDVSILDTFQMVAPIFSTG